MREHAEITDWNHRECCQLRGRKVRRVPAGDGSHQMTAYRLLSSALPPSVMRRRSQPNTEMEFLSVTTGHERRTEGSFYAYALCTLGLNDDCHRRRFL
jgi:hypothetical protein